MKVNSYVKGQKPGTLKGPFSSNCNNHSDDGKKISLQPWFTGLLLMAS